MQIKFYILAILWLPGIVYAKTYPSPPDGSNIIGQVNVAIVKPWDTFHTIAHRFDLGYQQMVDANPKIDPKWLLSGSKIITPSEFILPPGPRKGIVINLAEMRLYYYLPKQHEIMTFPLGIGILGWETPTGNMHIVRKIKNPTWVPTQSIIKAAKAHGYIIPNKIGPGPKNPLGDYALRLSDPTYLIHGTNKPATIGMRSSSGCIRLYPEDIMQLFAVVPKNTPVRIIDKDYKVGWRNKALFLQVYPVLKHKGKTVSLNNTAMVKAILAVVKTQPAKINWHKVSMVASQQTGIPEVIGVKLKNQATYKKIIMQHTKKIKTITISKNKVVAKNQTAKKTAKTTAKTTDIETTVYKIWEYLF